MMADFIEKRNKKFVIESKDINIRSSIKKFDLPDEGEPGSQRYTDKKQ